MSSFDASADVMKALSSFNLASLFVEYPSKWFERNPGEKPPIELPAMACTLDQVRGTVKYFLLNKPSHRLSPDLVLLYFRKLAGDMQARLDGDWTSFGLTIGKAGSEIGPLDIVNVKDRAAVKLKLDPSATAGPEDDLWILMGLAALFYHSASVAGNANGIRASPEILEQWKNVGFRLGLFCKHNYTLTDESCYRIMIAVFDMFLFKFPDHKLHAARNLTSVSRFQGCATYQSFNRLSELINKDFREIQKWLWTAQLQKEFLEITTPGHEMDQPYSYAPYFISLQLSCNSPYSESANPSLYIFTNIVRAIMNDQDARYARIPEEMIIPNVPINALVYTYTLMHGEDQLVGLPKGNDLVEWFKWFSKNHSSYLHSYMNIRPPKALIQKLQRTWSAFGQDPPGSIGKMLYNLKP